MKTARLSPVESFSSGLKKLASFSAILWALTSKLWLFIIYGFQTNDCSDMRQMWAKSKPTLFQRLIPTNADLKHYQMCNAFNCDQYLTQCQLKRYSLFSTLYGLFYYFSILIYFSHFLEALLSNWILFSLLKPNHLVILISFKIKAIAIQSLFSIRDYFFFKLELKSLDLM
jgi:hypothetical protein